MKKYLKIIVLYLIVLAVFFVVTIKQNPDALCDYTYDVVADGTKFTTHKIVDGDLLEQTFVASHNNLKNICLVFSDDTAEEEETRLINCSMQVSLYNMTDNYLVQEWDISSEYHLANKYFTFNLSKPENTSVNKSYKILISSKGAFADNAFSMRRTETDHVCESGQATLNGRNLGYDIVFTSEYESEPRILEIHAIANIVNIIFILSVEVFIFFALIFACFKIYSQRNRIKEYILKNGKMVSLSMIGIVIVSAIIEIIVSHLVVGKNSLGEYFVWQRFVIYMCLGLCVFELVLYTKKKIQTIEQLFLCIMLTLGFLLVSTQSNVAGMNWDGQIHYERVHGIAYFTSVENTLMDIDMSTPRFGPKTTRLSEIKSVYDETAKYARVVLYKSHVQLTTNGYLFIAYIPTAMALRFSRALGLSFAGQMAICRLANFLLYTCLVYEAIKKLKYGKATVMAISMLPTALFIAANFAYDHWVTGFTILMVGYILGEYQEKERLITIKSLLIIFIGGAVGFLPKAIYFPLFLLFWMLPKEKFKSTAKCIWWKAVALFDALLLASTFMLPIITAGTSALGSGDARGGGGVNSTEQLNFILSQPWEYTKILLRFLGVEYLNPLQCSGYTTLMAYLGVGSLSIVSFLIMLFSINIGRNKLGKEPLEWQHRAWTILIIFGTTCLVATALYISFTPVKFETINGCQHRYLLPLLFPVLYMCNITRVSDWINDKISLRLQNVILMSAIAFSVIACYLQVWIGRLY